MYNLFPNNLGLVYSLNHQGIKLENGYHLAERQTEKQIFVNDLKKCTNFDITLGDQSSALCTSIFSHWVHWPLK